MEIDRSIRKLVCYGLEKGLFSKRDEVYTTNRLLEILGLDGFRSSDSFSDVDLEETLDELLCYAVEKGLIEDTVTQRDLFDTKLMGALLPRPGEVTDRFYRLYDTSPKDATDYLYTFSQDSNYIRRYRVKKDLKWITKTAYGDLDITINLSKPEKDPKAIAAAKNAPQSGYPKCMLCKECEGYAGRLTFPARQNHRVIPLCINDSDWFFQYSPYSYYNEHCIVFKAEHIPMAIDKDTFRELLDFVRQFPDYFIGSNADLPIVGGSILSHDHFQGGRYTFAMAKAEIETPLTFSGFEEVNAGILKWPMSVIRLSHSDPDKIVALADKILTVWRGYTDESAFLFAQTDGVPHNTITPIARRKGEDYELDLVLRNNITTEEHPLGVYHPHAELHHIKKENIGLIEVMGLAVLPSRLKSEMTALEEAILENRDLKTDETLAKHADWAKEIKQKYPDLDRGNIAEVLEQEIGHVFCRVLEHAGVYKRTREGQQAFLAFAQRVNQCS